MHVGQKLVPGQNLTSEGGSFSLSLTSQGLFAYINSNPAQRYYSFPITNTYKISYVQFQNQILAFFGVDSLSPDKPYRELEIELASPLVQCKYMRFEPDGHLRVYDGDWMQVDDVLTNSIGDDCGYPTICSNYSICSNGQCSCPPPINGTSYFRANQ
jgi:hypothetical protein